VTVVGDFSSATAAARAHDDAAHALGGPLDHVVSSLGYITTVPTPPTATSYAALAANLAGDFEPTFNAAAGFLPKMKDRAGASFTMMSGGYAHRVVKPVAWAAVRERRR
jgi:NAD(P)-dependent dehydrogenase (short-subunit alcohol dehydrogenase family)